jgi:outer membrane protein TolC
MAIGLLAFWAAGCTMKHYKESADNEVYKILGQKSEIVLGKKEKYDIEQIAKDPLLGLLRATEAPFAVPEEQKRATEMPQIISLRKAVDIAFYNSRDYQTQKEGLYMTALALTEERHNFSAQFSGLISSLWKRNPVTGASRGTESEPTLESSTDFGVTKLFSTGATLGINLSTEFLRHLTGDPRQTAASILAVRIIQPLWRGAGQTVVEENLTQAEREVIYSVRFFARFGKSLAVNIATGYYRVLQQRDVVRNEVANYTNLVKARERTQAMATAGRLPQFQVDQAMQDELRAKDRWISAIQNYYGQLDQFKITLGLTTDVNVDLDDADLKALVATEVKPFTMSAEDAVAVALKKRLDLMTTADRIADAQRKIKVAENGLGAQVDLVFDSSTSSEPMTKKTDTVLKAGKFEWSKTQMDAGLNIDLPLDRLNERNTYRTTLISLARAVRQFSLDADNVKLEVRDDWRAVQQSIESYKIQKNGVALAQRRVDSTKMLLDAGRVETRDYLDAQSSLLEAQNALTQAMTNHVVSRLQFYLDIETLTIDEKGLWLEEPGNTNKPQTTEGPKDESKQN